MIKIHEKTECYNQKDAEYRIRARALVAQMTLEEKVSQTMHRSEAIERLGISHYNWWNESIHGVGRAGVATVFPQTIGLGATFDPELIGKVGETIAEEARAKFNAQIENDDNDIYKGLTFWAPNINIFRDPRWGRGQETYGEDPYLTSRMGVSFIKGMQGDGEFMKAATCVKHFAVHSGPEKGRHGFNAEVGVKDLYETYLPAFYAGITEAHAEGVMGAYNAVNEEPCCGSHTLLQNILRKEWEFSGYVTSDCWAIKDFHEKFHYTDNAVESAALAMNSGCNLNCGSIFGQLYLAVVRGLVPEECIDEAVTQLLVTRMKLGLFEEKRPFADIPYTNNDSPENRAFNLEVSEKSQVLLKNDGILPLKKEKYHTIGVIGPNANNRTALVGNYEGTASRYITPLEGIQDYVGDECRVLFSEGCHLYKDRISGLAQYENDRFSEAKAVAEAADIVILCLGLDGTLEGEEGDAGNEFSGGDKLSLKYPDPQLKLMELVVSCGKPVILLSLTGSTMDLRYAADNVNAIVECWYPGAMGGKAIANLLFGEANFEGKLPMTVYRCTEDLPDFKDYSMKDRTYRYMKAPAMYPFGYGLSYTEFDIESTISGDSIGKDGKIIVKAKVKNVGNQEGSETVQVYVEVPVEGAPKYQMKGLKKVFLKPDEEKTVDIILEDNAFALFDDEAKLRLYKGTANIYVGSSQPDEVSARLTGRKPDKYTVKIKNDEILYEGELSKGESISAPDCENYAY